MNINKAIFKLLFVIRSLFSGFILIFIASCLLLFFNLERQADVNTIKILKIAVFQYSFRPTLDDAVDAFIKTIAVKGYIDGEKIVIKRYNAEADTAAGTAIANEIVNSKFDMVVTVSTPALQIMANANRSAKIPHIFGVVTDPAGAGVGISNDDPYKHPEYIAGIGTFQPVEKVIRLAKSINPHLKKLGAPWTLGEKCAEACVIKARKTCAESGITLVEMPVENSASVLEAVRALNLKGVEAIWVGGDNIIEMAIETVIKAGHEAGIPVITNNPDHALSGAFVTLGANYYEVGVKLGELTAEILSGRAMRSVPIENIVPENLVINIKDNKHINNLWKLPDEVLKRASKIIE